MAQRRLRGMELPRPIVAIHNAFDAWEREKEKRTKQNDRVTDAVAKLIDLMKQNRSKLKPIGKRGAGTLYNVAGYHIVLSSKDKIEGHHKEHVG